MTIIQNDKWYLEAQHLNNINEELDWDSMNINETTGGKSFIHYPNIPSGYPSIAVELESFGEFRLPKNYNSGDETTAKRYPETYLGSDNNYYVFIPMYEYTTNTGVHVTKVVTTLQRNDTQEILIPSEEKSIESTSGFYRFRVKEEDSDIYYIQKRTSWFDPKDLCSFKEDEDINFNKMDSYSLYKVNIGPSCNVQLELTVDYYFYNVKLGTYTVVFNPYMLDRIKNYNIGELVPENDYHGYGVQYVPQFYELNPSTLYKDIVKSVNVNISEEIFDLPGLHLPGLHSQKNRYLHPLRIQKVSTVPAEEIQKGVTEYVSSSMLRIPYSKIQNTYKIDTEGDGNYLYKYPVNPLEPINIHYKLELYPNNCSIGIWAPDDYTIITDDFTSNSEQTAVRYTIFPGKSDFERNLVIKGKYSKDGLNQLENNDFLKYSSSDDDTKNYPYYTYEKTFNTIQDFKDEKLENHKLASLKIQAVLCDSNVGYSYIDKSNNEEGPTVAEVVDAKNYTNHFQRLGLAGDDYLDYTMSYDCPFSANNQADYKVIAQFNTLCKIDDTYYLGYKTSDGAVYPSNINSNNNYLTANCRSENNLIFTENVDYVIKHYEGTSLYHQGLVYFQFIQKATQTISLSKGVYVININYINDNNQIGISKPPTIQLNERILNPTPDTTNSLSAVIYLPKNDTVTVTIPMLTNIASMGLYKIYEDEGTEKQKEKLKDLHQSNTIQILDNTLDYTYLQTVHTYKEDNIKCLDKVYNYTGNPQHGYQILDQKNPHYTISDDNLTAKGLGEKIQIRE